MVYELAASQIVFSTLSCHHDFQELFKKRYLLEGQEAFTGTKLTFAQLDTF